MLPGQTTNMVENDVSVVPVRLARSGARKGWDTFFPSLQHPWVPSGGREHMPHYFVLGNWTEQGIRNVRESPKRVDAAKELAAKLGGRLEVYYTMGQYDFVAVGELPNDDAVMTLALRLGSEGNVRTTTLKAWTQGEGTKVIAKLP
jgi:uncharacterized protein with GYD domain